MSTFGALTNELLVDLNEQEITESDWASAKGVQKQAKNAINKALSHIYSEHHTWDFNAVEHTQTLIIGTQEYAWPLKFNNVDWNSFQVQALGSIDDTTLVRIERDEWYTKYRDDDTSTDTSTYETPKFVFKTHGNGFGISPKPDAAYVLKYRYYKSFTPLSAYTDNCEIPEEYNHVVLAGGLMHYNLFLDNLEQANWIKNNLFDKHMKSLRTLLINDDYNMRDTRVNF